MSSVDKRPNGKWRARYREYPGGPQKTKSFDRKSDAERWLVETQHRLLSGTYVAPEVGRVTLAAWVELYVGRQQWRANTISAARVALAPALAKLGDRPLSSIRKADVQALLAGMKRAPGTVRLTRQHLSGVMAAAVDDDLIPRNPVTGTKVAGGGAGEVVPPTTAMVEAIHDAAPKWFQPAIVLGAGIGLRQSEASGLTADRIDWLGERSVRIDRQWASQRGAWQFEPPKSEASIRTIPAAQFVLDQLAQHVDGREGFVLHRDGEPVGYNTFGNHWRATVKRAGLEPMRFHVLRHHFASALISAGCSIKAVQKALGHASAATTLNVYGHLFEGDEDRIRAAIEQAFNPAEDSLRTAEGRSAT